MSSYPLLAVWGLGTNEVWAVGGRTAGYVLRWDGLTWTVMARHQNLYRIEGVWASAPEDLWVVGYRAAGPSEIHHWDGSAWSTSVTNINAILHHAWGSSASDLWVIGASGTILHR